MSEQVLSGESQGTLTSAPETDVILAAQLCKHDGEEDQPQNPMHLTGM